MGRKKKLTVSDGDVPFEIAFAVRVPESLYAPINIYCVVLEYCLSELGSSLSWNHTGKAGSHWWSKRVHMFLMGSSCWADILTAMPSKAVMTAVNEAYMIIVWNGCLDPNKASQWLPRLRARQLTRTTTLQGRE